MDILSKRIIMTVMSLILVGGTLEAVRRRSLRERYALPTAFRQFLDG